MSDIFLKQKKKAYIARKNLSFPMNSQTRPCLIWYGSDLSTTHTTQFFPEQISLHSSNFGHKRRTNLRAVTASTTDSAIVSYTNFYASHASLTYALHPFRSLQPHSVLFHWMLEPNYWCTVLTILDHLCITRTQPKPLKYVVIISTAEPSVKKYWD